MLRPYDSMIMKNSCLEQIACVESICVSTGGIPKRPVNSVRVTRAGLEGDGHNHEKHNRPTQAVCLQDAELLEALYREGYPVSHGTIGENLTVRHLRVQNLPSGTILNFTGGVVLELTRERKPCYVLDSINPRLKEAIMGRCGFYAQVLKEGNLTPGEKIQLIPPAFDC